MEHSYAEYRQQRLLKHEPSGKGHPQLHHGIRYGGTIGKDSTALQRASSISKKTGDEIDEDLDSGHKIVRTENPPETHEFDTWDDVEEQDYYQKYKKGA